MLLLVVALFWTWKASMLLILTLGYGLSGPIQYGLRILRDRNRPAIAATGSASPQLRPTDKGHAI